jgi:hypothetical protein
VLAIHLFRFILQTLIAKRGEVPITKIVQGCETTVFKSKFKYGKWGEFVGTYDAVVKGNIASLLNESV